MSESQSSETCMSNNQQSSRSVLLVLLARQDGITGSLKSIEKGLESDRAQKKEIEISMLCHTEWLQKMKN